MESVQDPALLKSRTESWDTGGLDAALPQYFQMLNAVFGNLLHKE